MAGQQRVISSTFNVNTVDETVSLQAQYAPNDNPTASQIHNTWQDGDLYMRTKMTNETTWSDWHKIVGEKGGETDYSFAVSSQLSSTSSSTPPLDCESESSWHDTPQAVTPQKPYLWMRIKKKVWNESTQQYDVVSTSYARLSAESNYIADLDNEMDSIECNNLGYPKSVQTVTTKATLYRGSTLLSSTIAVYDDDTSGAQYTNGTAKDGITISWNNTTGVINVAFATSTIRTEKEVFCIKLTATDSGQPIVRLLYLTVNCVRGTALYRLVPSTDTITKRKNGTRVPSGNITCDVQKIVNGVISTPVASEYSLKMKVDDGSEVDYDTVAVSTITSSIEYILRVPQTSGTIVDRERVPLLTDGIDGTSAFVVDLENEMTSVALNENGETISEIDFYFMVSAYYGTHDVLNDSGCSVSASCDDSDVKITDTDAKTLGIRVHVPLGTALSETTDVSVTVVHTSYGTRTVIFTLAGVRGGKDAVLQELLPTLDNITFSRLANGSLSPSSRNLDLSIKKTQGSVTTIQSISSSNLAIRWSTVSMPETSSGGSSWSQGSATGITWSITTMQIANTVEASNIYIAAFNSNGTLVDRETIPIIKDGQHGESSWLADLDNEMDSVSCDDIGHPVSEQTVSTRISLYLGRTPKVFKITAITRNGSSNMGIGVTVDPVVSSTERSTPTTFAVTYATTATISGKDDFAITVEAVEDNTVTRTLHFTVNGIKGDVYNLSPSTGDMVFSVDANDAYQPSAGYNVSCKVRRRGVNGGITDITTGLNNIDGKGMALFFRWLNADGNQSDESGDTSGGNATHWFIGYESTSPYGMKTSLVPPTTPLSAMEWCISTAANGDSVTDASIIDREVIPIIKSGKKGDDAPVAFADPEKITIQCDQNGNVKAQVSTNVTFSLKVGSHNVTPSSVSCDSHPTNVTIGNGSTDYTKSITVPTSQTASGIASGCTFTVTGTYDNKQFSAKVTVALIGSTQGETGGTGQRGKTGRFYYYAQEWSDSTSVSYIVSDAQAPYFKYGNNYWVFNPQNNYPSGISMHDMGTPSSSDPNWQIMTNDFKYIITEAIFGNYAHFGSFIIFGDWQLSTNGEIDGTPYNNSANIGGTVITSDGTSSFSIKGYTLFDPSYPLGDTIVVTSGGSTDKVVISNQENTKTIATVYLVSNCVYKFKCKGRRYSDSYSVFVRLRSISGSNGTWAPVYYPSTSDYESQTFTFRPQTSGTFYLEMYQPSLPSSYDVTAGGETSYWLLTRVTFRPILAFDGMTGKTYQSDAHMRGVITSEDVLNGNKIVIDAPNGGMRMTGPVRVDEQTHRPNGDARENLIEMLFETDPDTNTRIGTFYVRDGRKKMETQVDPEYGVRCSNKILSDERVAELRYDGMSIKEGSESTYREVSTDPVGFGLVVGDGSSQKKLLINEDGVSIRIGTTTHTKTWAQILGF